jgi:hypothetical protein
LNQLALDDKEYDGILTLNPLSWKIWRACNNASRWQFGYNSAFEGLMSERVAKN